MRHIKMQTKVLCKLPHPQLQRHHRQKKQSICECFFFLSSHTHPLFISEVFGDDDLMVSALSDINVFVRLFFKMRLGEFVDSQQWEILCLPRTN